MTNFWDFWVIFVGGLLAGYLQNEGSRGGERVGIRVGILWSALLVFHSVASLRGASVVANAARLLHPGGGLQLYFTAICALFFVSVAITGGVVGGSLADRNRLG